jgi:hypothetical protein
MHNYGSFMEVSIRGESLHFTCWLGTVEEREALYREPLRLLSGIRPGGLWIVGLRGGGETYYGGFDLSLSSLPVGPLPEFLDSMESVSLHVRVRGERTHDEFVLPIGPEVRAEIRLILRQQWARRKKGIREEAVKELARTFDAVGEENRVHISATYHLAKKLSRARARACDGISA